MAFITLSGTLRDPTSELAVGDQIRFTHKSTTGETVEGAVSVLTIDPSGAYSKDLQYGLVLVEYKDVRTSQFKNLGVATVNGSNPATSIPELLNALVPVSSAELIEFQAILADAVTARNEAEAFAASIDLINDLSQTYEFPTVSALKSNAIIFPLGKVLSTGGYYDGWATTLIPDGSANYIVATLQSVRDTKGEPAWVPDGWGDHYLYGGITHVAMLQSDQYIELKQYGAKPYVDEDQSLPFIAAWKAATTQTTSPHEVSSKGLNIGVGVFEVRQNSFLSQTGFSVTNGRRVTLKGEGHGQSVLVFRPTLAGAYMYDQRADPDVHFNGLEFSDMSVRLKADLNAGGAVHGLFLNSQIGQVNQHFQYKNLHVTGLPTSNWFATQGIFNDDLSNYDNCRLVGFKSILVIDNSESVGHKFTNTDIGGLYGFAFEVGSGGMITMTGGAVETDGLATNECGLLNLSSPATSSPNAGSLYSFTGIRMERRNATSRIIRCLGSEVRQSVKFDTCNFGNASFDNAFAIIAIANKLNVTFDTCTLPINNASKLAFIDNPNPAVEYAQANGIDSVINFINNKRFGGGTGDKEYYADYSNVTIPTTKQGQVVVYEGNQGLPGISEYGCQFGTGMSYARKSGGLIQFRGFVFPFTDGATPTNPSQYFNLQVAQFAYVKEVTVSRASLPSGGIPVIWEIVDKVEFDTPTTGVIFGESPSQNMNDEWDWTLQITKRFSGSIDERTLYLRQKPSNITVPVPASNVGDGIVFAVVM